VGVGRAGMQFSCRAEDCSALFCVIMVRCGGLERIWVRDPLPIHTELCVCE